MQLPRGTFREIRKSETIGEILTELERTKFSGICSISSGSGTGTLVLKSGKCILVKFHGKSGDTGWDELQKNLFEEVDAALSSLDEAQVQLSLEFNKACRLVRGGKSAQVAAEPQKSSPPLREPVKKPAPPSHPAASPEPQPQKVQPLFQRPAMPAPPVQQAPVRPAEEKRAAPSENPPDSGGTGSSFEKDIDTFDTMDLDNVTDKIRNDCKTMIKQLHLEHLMER